MSTVSNATVTLIDGTVADKFVQVDPSAGTPIAPAIRNTSLGTAQASITTTASLILAARSGGRGNARIRNTGANTVFVGNTTGVTATTGYPIPAGAESEFSTAAALYGIATTGTNVVGVQECY